MRTSNWILYEPMWKRCRFLHVNVTTKTNPSPQRARTQKNVWALSMQQIVEAMSLGINAMQFLYIQPEPFFRSHTMVRPQLH